MTLDEAVRQFEARFEHPAVDGFPYAWFEIPKKEQPPDDADTFSNPTVAVTRHFYVVVTSEGIRTDANTAIGIWRAKGFAPDDAIASWLEHANLYADQVGPGRLYWRVRPELGQPLKRGPWTVYSRMVIVPEEVFA